MKGTSTVISVIGYKPILLCESTMLMIAMGTWLLRSHHGGRGISSSHMENFCYMMPMRQIQTPNS